MAIEFRCGPCGRLLRTGDDTAGKQAQCPECGALTRVPAPAQPPARSAPPLAPLEAGSPFGPGATTVMTPDADHPYQSPGQLGPAPPGESKAVVALILGLTGMILWCCPLIGLPVTVCGLVFGIRSLHGKDATMAVVAIVLSSIGLLLTILNAIAGVLIMLAG